MNGWFTHVREIQNTEELYWFHPKCLNIVETAADFWIIIRAIQVSGAVHVRFESTPGASRASQDRRLMLADSLQVVRGRFTEGPACAESCC